MTKSRGHLGSLWSKPSATIYIRPQRYTKEFFDNSAYFSLSFFTKEFKPDLANLNKVSGNDEDKIEKTALTIIKTYYRNDDYHDMYVGKIVEVLME